VNLYLVVSEPIVIESPNWPAQDYCIAEIVRARSAKQAKYLAWKADPVASDCGYDVRQVPPMHVRTRRLGVDGPPGVLEAPDVPDWWWDLDQPLPRAGARGAA